MMKYFFWLPLVVVAAGVSTALLATPSLADSRLPLSAVTPLLRRVFPAPEATVRALSEITIEFNEPVGGVDASDLLINGTSAAKVRGFGAGPYSFIFPKPAAGQIAVAFATGHGIRALSADVAIAAAEKILGARVKGSDGDALIAKSIGDVKAKLN